MPVKDNDKVYFKIKSGDIKTGVYDAKTKMVMMSGGKRAKPPKRALHHTRKGAMDKPFVDVTNKDPILGAKPTKKDDGRSELLTAEANEKKAGFTRTFKGKFGQEKEPIGSKIYVITRGVNVSTGKASVVAGTIEGFTDKGIVIRADKGNVLKKDTSRKLGGENYHRTSYIWEKTSGKPTKKVVSWKTVRGFGKYDGNIGLKTIGG